MVWGTLSFNNDNTDIYSDLTWPLKEKCSPDTHVYTHAYLRVRGKGTLVVMNPENVQLIQPPMTIMGRTLVRFPFNMSIIMVGSCIGFFGGAVGRFT